MQLEKVDGPVEGLGKDEKLLLVCLKGKRGYFLQNRLKALGYTNTKVLEGATFFNDVKVKGVKSAVSPEEITRLKGLGFLRDKNTPDCFKCPCHHPQRKGGRRMRWQLSRRRPEGSAAGK